MIEVYHLLAIDFGFDTNATETFVKEDYIKVAEVDTDDLDTAFRLTNTIKESWMQNEEVTCIQRSRSTSVSDVMVKDGIAYQVDRIGFKVLTTVKEN